MIHHLAARYHLSKIIVMISLATMAHASLLVIPYSGGKIAGTAVITVNSAISVTPDTIQFGNRDATIHFNLESNILLATCGAVPTIIAQFEGAAAAIWQTPDSSTQWNSLTTMFPQRASLPLSQGWDGFDAMSPLMAAGFRLFSSSGYGCDVSEDYDMSPQWNRVVFMHFGSGRDFRGRFSFQVKRDTSYSLTPMLQYHILKSLTLHYVIAEESNDVSGAPVSIRRPTPSHRSDGAKAGGIEALYNPLGVKIREPKRFQAVVPLRR